MRKEEILALRERTLRDLAPGLEKKHVAPPQPDSRLHPEEVEKELFWIERLSYPGWPHTGSLAGLRYEVWYFQKREESLLALLCGNQPALASLAKALQPVFTSFANEGKYARRYRPAKDRSNTAELLAKVSPGSEGIWRIAPQSQEKLVKALETLILDTFPAMSHALQSHDADGTLEATFQQAVEERDPLAELQARFNQTHRR